MARFKSTISALLVCTLLWAQQSDTVILTELSYLRQLKDFAPAVQNGLLEVDIKQQEFLEARSAFEPKIKGKYALKEFEDKTYYNRLSSGVSIKTPLGIKLDGGFTNNSGVFLNPENNVPNDGLAYAGVEIPIGAGLLTDEDRTNVRQQRLENDAAGLVYTLTVNDLMLDAGEQYWDWFESALLIRIAEEALVLATNRRNFVIRKNRVGESADIDTLEAFINYQNRQAILLSNLVKWQKNKNYVLNYIWLPNRDSIVVAPQVDMDFSASLPDSLMNLAFVSSHPILSLLQTDSMINRANLFLAREYYKPQIDLALRLQEDAGDFADFNFQPGTNHYVGVNFYMPLFLRKQRAKAKQLELKGEMIGNKKREVTNKITNSQRALYENTKDLKRSVELWSVATKNYRKLLEAEIRKFNLGESSLFVVNNRELKWIDARTKYVKSYIEYRKTILKFYHSLGLLPTVI